MSAKEKAGVINIHGKEYQTVALRVQKFRDAHPDWSLTTSIIYRDLECVVVCAQIADQTGRVIANGHAEEFRKSSSINKTSALENSETSAIGRALAALGLGGTEFCSADELVNALTKKQPAEQLAEAAAEKGVTPTAGAMDGFSEEEQQFLRDLAHNVTTLAQEDIMLAVRMLDESHLQTEEKVAVWSLLASGVRSAIKKAKAKPTADEIAQQA